MAEPDGGPDPAGDRRPAADHGAERPNHDAGDEQESEPDPRFTFANERTFLAWSRTSLALAAAGLAFSQLLPPFPGVPWGRRAVGVPLIVLGGAFAIASYVEWDRAQHALRLRRPLPPTILPRILAGAIVTLALLAAVVVLVSRGTAQ